MLRVENLCTFAQPNVSFEVATGKCLALQGPSGSGKTTILRAIADLDKAGGLVFLDGAERSEMSAPEWRHLVRYIASEPGWWEDTPRGVFNNLSDTAASKLEKLLDNVGIETDLIDRPVSKLSTGERQRISLVRALIDDPRALLLDEPTAALDTANAALVEELIRYQKLSGKMILLVSHQTAQVRRLADDRLELDAPKTAEQAS